jgi:hypothetical protein
MRGKPPQFNLVVLDKTLPVPLSPPARRPRGFNVLDANGQALVYVYAEREER